MTTRTFLSQPMRQVHAHLTELMEAAGMEVRVDAAGNLRGVYGGARPRRRRFLIGSHLDTVRCRRVRRRSGCRAGRRARRVALTAAGCPVAIEVIGFSEEEGVRFGIPFIGSRALAGTLDAAVLEHRDADGVQYSRGDRRLRSRPARIAGDRTRRTRRLSRDSISSRDPCSTR